jgi:hypothetical protein
MQSLLATARPPEGGRSQPAIPDFQPQAQERREGLSETERRVLSEIQEKLQQFGVRADLPELRKTLIEEMFARPELCRGLAASFLLSKA